MDNHKICKICQLSLEFNFFRISKKTGKLLNPCKDCRRARKKKERLENKEQYSVAIALWAKNNPE